MATYFKEVYKEDFIVANHDIFQGNTVFFNRNHGYLEKDYTSTNGLYFSTDSGCFYNILLHMNVFFQFH